MKLLGSHKLELAEKDISAASDEPVKIDRASLGLSDRILPTAGPPLHHELCRVGDGEWRFHGIGIFL